MKDSILELIERSGEALTAFRLRFTEVRWGPIENNTGFIFFCFDGKNYRGALRDRNADLLLTANPEIDSAIAMRVFLDNDAKPV